MRTPFTAAAALLGLAATTLVASDHIRDLQKQAIESGRSELGYWGTDPKKYVTWSTHSNRLIPVYTFGTAGAGAGIDLTDYTGPNSAYRSEDRLRRIYGYLPTNTVNPDAEYLDQTDVYRIQKAALDAGKKRIILVVFDGTDWQTTRVATIWKTKQVGYDSGRGTGLHLQDYTAGGTTQFGFMVTSPHNDGTEIDVDKQIVKNPGGEKRGGYDPKLGGPTPWEYPGVDADYLIGKSKHPGSGHAYTDSSSSASSMTTGAKIYNNSVNVDPTGIPLETIALQAQRKGYAAGTVTSVPISHATPACSYAHNVDRDDFQDLTRDLLGLKSISHPASPMPGLDVLIGAGHGVIRDVDKGQGKNFMPGNRYLTDDDLAAIDVKNGGQYLVSQRAAGEKGGERLLKAAHEAAEKGTRFFGYYGAATELSKDGNLPFRTADGGYDPAPGNKSKGGTYPQADIDENPSLADMAEAALTVLSKDPDGFWLLVEAGDVDWGNHDNNIDTSIGALLAGDEAVKRVTDWIDQHGGWDDTVMIVTADHGHYMTLEKPELLLPAEGRETRDESREKGE